MNDFLTNEFIEGRRRHLVNKRMETLRRSTIPSSMPDAHREYKLKEVVPAIDAALQRIHDEEYGTCIDCGESIAQVRLELRPEASRCVTCQEEFENLHRNKEVRSEPSLFAGT